MAGCEGRFSCVLHLSLTHIHGVVLLFFFFLPFMGGHEWDTLPALPDELLGCIVKLPSGMHRINIGCQPDRCGEVPGPSAILSTVLTHYASASRRPVTRTHLGGRTVGMQKQQGWLRQGSDVPCSTCSPGHQRRGPCKACRVRHTNWSHYIACFVSCFTGLSHDLLKAREVICEQRMSACMSCVQHRGCRQLCKGAMPQPFMPLM